MEKATYSEGFKEQALSKVFSRGGRTLQAVADESNIRVHPLKNSGISLPGSPQRQAVTLVGPTAPAGRGVATGLARLRTSGSGMAGGGEV